MDDAVRRALAPFERGATRGEGPYQVQQDLQVMMQDLVGIVRTAPRDGARARGHRPARGSARHGSACTGNREYNPGWHTALDLDNLLTVSEAVTRAALERKESRGGHFRDDCPDKDPAYAKFNIVIRQGRGRRDAARRASRSRRCRPELKRVIEEQK